VDGALAGFLRKVTVGGELAPHLAKHGDFPSKRRENQILHKLRRALSQSGAQASRSTLARWRRILADDVHRFILIGQALGAAMIPTWLFSRAFGDPPAQGFRSRPRLARVVADVFDFGATRAASQADLGAMTDYDNWEPYHEFGS
jgi:hypothetical protein